MKRALPFAWMGLALACGGTSPAGPGTASTPQGATFPSTDGVRLSYALDLPPGSGPFPAIVFGHGSGRTTKDEAMVVKSAMTRLGFAVLRYDKRGVGASTGSYEGVGPINGARVLGELADDMAAGVAFLRTRPEIDGHRIGLMGISQAGWVIPLAAERAPDVRYMILVSGPTVPVGLEIYYSDLAEGTATGYDELSARLREYQGPLGFDPRPHLEGLNVPGLWFLGAQDRSIPTRETITILSELRTTGHAYRWHLFDPYGHFIPQDEYVSEAAAFAAGFR
jgi:dipeptidyl aminopeptidase/acylaminoacyl peptidase